MPVLDALSLDADLRLLASGQQPSSPAPAEYQRLRTLFDPVRNIYVSGFPFLIADHLMLKDASQVAVIRKANQAMFCSAVFAGGIGQLALDQAFLDVFVPMNDQLQQTQSCIWLELKTQGFMTAMRLKAAPPNQVMSDLFPQGTEHRLLARHPANKSLTMSEQDFMSRFEARRKTLYDHVARNTLPDLDQKFRYEELAREVTNFLIKTYGTARSPAPPNGIATAPEASQPQGYAQAQTQSSTPANTSLPLPQLPASIDSLPSFDSGDFFQLAARAAEIALRGTVSPVIGTAKPVVQPSPIPAPQPRPNAAAQLGYQQQAPPQNGIQGTPNPPVSTANTYPAPGRTPLPTEQPKSGTTERIDQPPESGRHPQAGGVVKDAGSAENRDIKVERTAHNESMEEPSMDRHTSPVVASAVPAGSVGDDFEAMIAQAAEAASAT
ncbi:uncharacterized protein HMPREF1541_03758 [Cyphellophora europaea CBS 101466]|uniref:Telomere repeat-binding factor dimerisation domain-containing protein n=1 Tax=Cyphellophora europaea (strain CBS 101466) TaxID=1220924 RepID=W2RZ99_CYPE1|nr:uncharacterized protein HMPREF1541_03758 [Cyphellophora europaea CBS 101466]ETN41821.1 hypothetical protein HMPREF1541_03758 [Cyphellophora europaea CBS 101466]